MDSQHTFAVDLIIMTLLPYKVFEGLLFVSTEAKVLSLSSKAREEPPHRVNKWQQQQQQQGKKW